MNQRDPSEQLARLRREIDLGMQDVKAGRVIKIRSKAEQRKFFDDIKRDGRARRSRMP